MSDHIILNEFYNQLGPVNLLAVRSHQWFFKHHSFNWVKEVRLYSFVCMDCSATLTLNTLANIEYTNIQRFTNQGSVFLNCKEFDVAEIICNEV